jgi:hypothetical protein
MRRSVLTTLLLLGAVAVLGVVAPARAHVAERASIDTSVAIVDLDAERVAPASPAPVGSVVTAARTSSAVSWLPLLILTTSLIAGCRSRRRVAGLLIALLAVLAFEVGLHSVHHLGEPPEAARCVVETVSSNLSGAAGEPMSVVAPASTADLAPHLDSLAPPRHLPRPDRGRGPPVLA